MNEEEEDREGVVNFTPSAESVNLIGLCTYGCLVGTTSINSFLRVGLVR